MQYPAEAAVCSQRGAVLTAALRWTAAAGSTTNASFTGYVNDAEVYSVIGSNISFHDRDASYSISAGDYFVIHSEAIGTDEGDWTFVLLEESIQYVLIRVDLPPMNS